MLSQPRRKLGKRLLGVEFLRINSNPIVQIFRFAADQPDPFASHDLFTPSFHMGNVADAAHTKPSRYPVTNATSTNAPFTGDRTTSALGDG